VCKGSEASAILGLPFQRTLNIILNLIDGVISVETQHPPNGDRPLVCPTKDRAASLQHFACYSGLGDEICFMFGSSIGIVNSSSINRKGLLFAENGYRSKQLLCDGLHLIFHELRCNL
jgi:hypothetical protein